MPTRKPRKDVEPKPQQPAPDSSDSRELTDDELKSVSGGMGSLGTFLSSLDTEGCVSKL